MSSLLPGHADDPVRRAISANRSLLVAAFGFSAVMSVLTLTTSFYMLQVYDRVLSSHSIDTLLLLTIIAAGALAVLSLLDSLRTRLLHRIGIRVGGSLSAVVLRAMISTTSQAGGLAPRSGLRDVDTIRGFFGSGGFASLMDAPFIAFYLAVLALLHPVFLAIVLIGGAALIAIALLGHRASDAMLIGSFQLAARAHEFAEDGLHNADVLEGMGMSAGFADRWRELWISSQQKSVVASDSGSRFSSLSRGIRLFLQIALLGAGAVLILNYQATGGIMIAASIIGSRALQPIESLASGWQGVVAARLAWERVVTLLDRAPRRDEGMNLPRPKGHLRALGVHYATQDRRPILCDVSLEIEPGETLGIIGPSGSGKSTLLRLLVGAWPCTAGSVRLDGAEIYSWPRSSLGCHIGYLPQDVELFSGTVKDNIARLTPGSAEDIVRAAQRARVHDMILQLPKGYDTVIGAAGHRLSGGQSQRIAIARALYGEPRVVVLDEPNANLDSAGEQALRETLAELKAEGVSVIVVTHRQSLLSAANKILVLRTNGTVEAFGAADKVLAGQAAGLRTGSGLKLATAPVVTVRHSA